MPRLPAGESHAISTQRPAGAAIRRFLIALIGAVIVTTGASSAVAAEAVVGAAGDIACEPSNRYFLSGNGSSTMCHQKWTSNVLVNGGFDAVIPLGDNQYVCSGTPELTGSYEPSWGRVKAITKPVPGNHEFYASGGTGCDTTAKAAPYFSYFQSQLAALGATASDPTKGYYSYDLGDWHIITLNTGDACKVAKCGAGSPQELWLKADLAAHPNVCTMAVMHYPRFSSKTPLPAYTQAFVNALYAGGVDVLLTGHVHNYERFAPQNAAGAADPAFGLRAFVVGSGGMSLEGFPTTAAANSEVRSRTFGILKLSLHPTSYDWQFINDGRNGVTFTDAGAGACHGAPGSTDSTPPTAAVAAPAAGATVSGTTAFSATATDNVAVQSVQFRVDGTTVATDTTSPYSTAWDTTSVANGAHTLTVVATDTSGNSTTSAPVGVTVANDVTPPTVTLTAPADGATLTGATTLTASAADDTAVASVRFAVDGATLSTDTGAPYSAGLDTTTLTNGSHALSATATDTAGNESPPSTVTITVDNQVAPPTVTLTAPANGATVGGTVTLSATASSAIGVSAVDFLVDGATLSTDTGAPYSASWNTSALANGAHTLAARVTDTAGTQVTSEVATVTVANDTTPPTVGIDSPSDGATVSGTTTISASASDDTSVASVQFRVDGVTIATDTSAPYSAAWATGSVANGSHALTAIATDAAGNPTTSAPVTVSVTNVAATIARRASATTSGTSGTPTITLPPSVVAGDLALVTVATSSSSATFATNPAGWTKVISTKGVDFNSAVWSHVVQAGDAGSAVAFPSSATTDYWTAGVVVYSGVNATTPIVGAAGSAPTTQVQAVTPGPVATGIDGAMVVSFASVDVSTARTWTEDAGAEIFDVQPTALSLVANEQVAPTVTPATRTFTISGAIQELTGYLVVLRPA